MATYSPSRDHPSGTGDASAAVFYIVVAIVSMAIAIPLAIATFAS